LIAGTANKKTRVLWITFSVNSGTNQMWLASSPSGTTLTGNMQLGVNPWFPYFPSPGSFVCETNLGESIILRVLNGTVLTGYTAEYTTY
jgi:hypothetical protein